MPVLSEPSTPGPILSLQACPCPTAHRDNIDSDRNDDCRADFDDVDDDDNDNDQDNDDDYDDGDVPDFRRDDIVMTTANSVHFD